MRRLLAVLVPLLLVLTACGDDDDAADGPTTTVADVAEVPETEEEPAADEQDDATDTSEQASPETTVPAEDGAAEDGPASEAGDGEGLGDAVLASDLDPAGLVPGPGQTGATGRFEAELVDGTLCIDMVVEGLDSGVTEAHLHSGRSGDEGPVVVEIGLPTSTGEGTATWSVACADVADEVIDDLADAPELAYVDVHTGAHPGGAVRGQLTVISIFDRTLD